jgi:hypothetical protein
LCIRQQPHLLGVPCHTTSLVLVRHVCVQLQFVGARGWVVGVPGLSPSLCRCVLGRWCARGGSALGLCPFLLMKYHWFVAVLCVSRVPGSVHGVSP